MLLIIDSNAENISQLRHILEESYAVQSASSVKEGIRLYDALHLKVRTVLINDRTGDVPIEELIEQLQAISHLPELIIYSESENIRNAVSVMKKGAFSYFTKPFTGPKILHLLDQALEEFDIVKKLETYSKTETGAQIDPEYFDDLTASLGASHEVSISLSKLKALLHHPESLGLYANTKPRILIVEDEEMYRRILTDFLKKDYDVLVAEDCKSALEVAKSHGPVQLILLDVFLPDGSGADLIPQFLELSPLTKIIIVTAFEFLDIAVKSLKDGACDYLNKPFMKKDILAAVSAALKSQYVHSIFPKLSQKLIQESLSEDARLELLQALCKIRSDKGKPVVMADIYLFFPKLQTASIPPGFPLPQHILDKGIRSFIETLSQG